MPRFERRGFKRFGQRVDLPKPIKVGEEYDVEINEVGSRGDGIARIKNFVVFVSDTKKGEKAHIKIKEVRNRFAIGEKISKAEAEEPSEEETPEEPEVPEETPEEPEEETEEPEEVPEETEEETE
jgi:predicted RNA-binding protein with TRAM domain